MPFNPKIVPTKTPQTTTPTLDASGRLRLEQELRSMRQNMNSMVDAIVEIQNHLKTM